MSHIIQSGSVFLRPIERGDAVLSHRWRSDVDVATLASLPGPVSLGQVEQRIERLVHQHDGEGLTFVICLRADELPIGEAMLFELDRGNGSSALGIFIGEVGEWGKGYGTDAVRALVSHGFGSLRLERIWLNVWTENERARRAYEAAGFVHEGTLRHDRFERGHFTDGHVMSILRDEWLSRSSPPAR